MQGVSTKPLLRAFADSPQAVKLASAAIRWMRVKPQRLGRDVWKISNTTL